MIENFLQSVKQFPGRPALWVENQLYTYAELYSIACGIAEKISQFPAERCIIFSERNLIAYAAILAALLTDKTYVPLNPISSIDTNLNLLNAIDSNLMVTTSHNAKQLLDRFSKPLTTILLDLYSIHKESKSNWTPSIRRQNKYAYLLFTSGSTGVPKGVLVSQHNVMSYVRNIINRCRPCEQDRFSQLSDLTFDFSVHDLFVAWSVGACVYVVSSKHLVRWQQFMKQHDLTFWASVPSTIQFFQQTEQLQPGVMPSLKYSVFCGEILSHTLANAWQLAAPYSVIDNLYGPTEASVACTGFIWQPENKTQCDAIPIGFPFPQQAIKIINDKNECVQTGELCLAGPQVVDGYWRNPISTHDRFFYLPNDQRLWYRTRDLVTWDETVGLIYQGRLDDQLKIRGRCVTKLEIELALRKIAQTSSVAVVPVFTDQLVKHIFAFVSHSNFTAQQILKIARMNLPEHMVPTEIIELTELPLNANGKTNYSVLKEQLNRFTSSRGLSAGSSAALISNENAS